MTRYFLIAFCAVLGCSSPQPDELRGSNLCDVDGDLALDLCEASIPSGSDQKIACTGSPLCGGGYQWFCDCLVAGEKVASCESSGEHACADNCCAFTEVSTFSQPCDKGEASCSGAYECVTAEPKHDDQASGDFCMLPCTDSGECGAWAGCVCKGGSAQTDGPVPDGFCECG